MSRSYHYREFETIMPLGSVQAASDILKMQRIMRDCISEISGLAQPAHSTSEEEARRAEEEYQLGWEKVRNMVKDIAMGITGEEIKFPHDIEEDRIRDKFGRALELEEEDSHYIAEDAVDDDEELEYEGPVITPANIVRALNKLLKKRQVQKGLSYLNDVIDEVKKSTK